MKEELCATATIVEAGKELGIEIIKTGRGLAGFFTKLTGLTDECTLGYISDKLQYFRYNRQLRIAEEINKKVKGRQLEPLPPKFLVPVIENASLEDEDELQDLWINLLDSWTDGKRKDSRRLTYVDILKNLSARDVYFLKSIYEEAQKNPNTVSYFKVDGRDEDGKLVKSKDSITMKSYNDIDVELPYFMEGIFSCEYNESVDNLIRLGCVRESKNTEEERRTLNLTFLGASFVEVCMIKGKS